MELELGLKITRTREDVSSSVDFRFSKDPFGPLMLSRETDSMFIVIIHLKGFKKEGIEIEINDEGNRITIRGSKPVEEMVLIRWMAWRKEVELRAFRKVFRIPDIVDLDKIKARFDEDDATLTITMPKRVKGYSGFKIEEEEEGVELGDTSEAENREEKIHKEKIEDENVEREESDEQSETDFQREEEFGEIVEDKERESKVLEGEEKGFSGGLGEEETEDEQNKILGFVEEEEIGEQGVKQELANSNTETEDAQDSHGRELVEQQAETTSNHFGSREFEEEEPDELNKSGEMEKNTSDEDCDGFSKVQWIEEPERRNEESKIQEMVQGETGDDGKEGKEKEKIVNTEMKNGDPKGEVDAKMGERFTPETADKKAEIGDDDYISRKVGDIEQRNSDAVKGQEERDETQELVPEEKVSDGGKGIITVAESHKSRKVQEIEEEQSHEEDKRRKHFQKLTGGEITSCGEVEDVEKEKKTRDANKRIKESIRKKTQQLVEEETKDCKEESKKEDKDSEESKTKTDHGVVREQELYEPKRDHKELEKEKIGNHEKEEKKKIADSEIEAERGSLRKVYGSEEHELHKQEIHKGRDKTRITGGEETSGQENESSINVQVIKPESHEKRYKTQEVVEAGHNDRKEEQQEEKIIAKAERETDKDGSKKVQEIEKQEYDDDDDGLSRVRVTKKTERHSEGNNIQETVEGKANDEGIGDEDMKEIVKMKIKNGDPKEEVDAKVGERYTPNIAKTEAKAEEFESDILEANEADKKHELVEKKEEEDENAKVKRQSEDISIISLQETEEQHSKGQNRHTKQELEEEKKPEAETSIANDTLKPVQERCEGKQKNFQEDTNTGKKIGDVDARKVQEIRQRVLDEPARCEIRESVKRKTNDGEKDIAETETGEKAPSRSKIHGEQDKIQELVEEKTNFSKNGKIKEEEETAEKKTEFGDENISRNLQGIEQRDTGAMKGQEEKDEIQEIVPEEKISDGGKGIIAVAENIVQNDKSRKVQEIDEQQSDEEDKRGKQFLKLREVEDVENEKKTIEADKRIEETIREAQEIEKKDSDVSGKYGKGDTIQELQGNRATYRNEQEEEKKDEAYSPEKITGKIEQELVNLNSQLEKENIEEGEKTQELVEEKTKDCKEEEEDKGSEESKTKTDDMVEGIREQELYEPETDHVSKIKDLIEEKTGDHDHDKEEEKEIAEAEIEAECSSLKKVRGSEEHDLNEPKIHKERDKTQKTGGEPSGQEKETENNNSTNVQEIKPESHEKRYKTQQVVEAGHNDSKEEHREEKIISKAELETDENSSKKVQEIEKQEYDDDDDDDDDGLSLVRVTKNTERHNEGSSIQDIVEGKTNDQGIGDEDMKETVKMEINNGGSKEEVVAKMGERSTPNIAESEEKAEEFESDILEADEADKIHELVEKKEEEDENAKVKRKSEEIGFISLQETEEQHSKGQKRDNKHEKIKELEEENKPEAETSIANGTLKPVQERCVGKQKIQKNIQEEKNNQQEEYEEEIIETGKKLDDADARKVQEIRQQELDEPARCETRELVKSKKNDEEKEIAETEEKEQVSSIPKLFREQDKIQELVEEKKSFSKNGKIKKEEEIAEKKTEFSDENISRKLQDSEAMIGEEEKDKIHELVLEEKVSDGGKGIVAVAATINENDKSRKVQEIDEKQSHEEDTCGNQFQKPRGGDISGRREVEDVENEKKTIEADKRIKETIREAQEIEKEDLDASGTHGKGDTIQERQENRATYGNKQEEEKKDEAHRPEKITGKVEHELVNLNSQLEQENIEGGDKNQELVEEEIKDCKEEETSKEDKGSEESKTKIGDVLRKVQVIENQELYEPKREDASKVKKVIEEKTGDHEKEEKEIAESVIEAECGSFRKVRGSEEGELTEPKIHKEHDKTRNSGEEQPKDQQKEEKENIVESETITKNDNSIDFQEVKVERPEKPESHEKRYKIQQVVEAEQEEEKVIVKAERKTDENSKKKVHEIEKQNDDELKRSMVQDKMQETEEKYKTRAMEEKEIVEKSTKSKDGSLRKVREGEDPELGRYKKHGEEDMSQELVETEISDHRGKVKKKEWDDILRSRETGRPDLDELEKHCKQRKIHQPVEKVKGEGKTENISEAGQKEINEQKIEGKAENCKDGDGEGMRGEKGKQGKSVETMSPESFKAESEDRIERKIRETKEQESNEKKNQDKEYKTEELEGKKMVNHEEKLMNEDDSLRKGKEFLEKESNVPRRREDEEKAEVETKFSNGKSREFEMSEMQGLGESEEKEDQKKIQKSVEEKTNAPEKEREGNDKIAEKEMQDKIDRRIKDQEIIGQESSELLKKGTRDKNPGLIVKGTEYHREEEKRMKERKIEELKKIAEEVSSRKVQQAKEQESDEIEKHRKPSEILQKHNIQESLDHGAEEMNEGGGYKAASQKKSVDLSHPRDVEEEGPDESERYAEQENMEELMAEEERNEDYDLVSEKEEKAKRIIPQVELQAKDEEMSEKLPEEETSDDKEGNRVGAAWGEGETKIRDDSFGKVREIEEQAEKQSFVEKETSGQAKASKNQETESRDDNSSSKSQGHEKQESHEQKRNEEQDKNKLLGETTNYCRNEEEDKEIAEAEVPRKLKRIETRESAEMAERHEELVEDKKNNQEGQDKRSMITEVLSKAEDNESKGPEGLRKQDKNREPVQQRLTDNPNDEENAKAETKGKENESRKTHQIKEQETSEQERLKEQGRIKELVEDRTCCYRETEFEDGSSEKIQEIDKEESIEPGRDKKRDKNQEPVDRETSEDDEEELEVEFEDEEEDWEAEVIQETDSHNEKNRQIRKMKLGFQLVGGSTLFMSLIVIVIKFIRSKRKIQCYKF